MLRRGIGRSAGGKEGSAQSLSDRVYEEIYRRISAEEWPQGTRLPTEVQMASDFAVSRTVLREALLRLRLDGLITSRPGAGSFVTAKPSRAVLELAEPGSIADLQRCYEFRVGVEGEAVALAAERRAPERIAEIAHALEAMDACIAAGGIGADEDIRFHVAVARATENDYYLRTIESSARAIMVGMRVAHALSPLPSSKRLALAHGEHKKMFAAIKAGDAVGARNLMRDHIEAARRRVLLGP